MGNFARACVAGDLYNRSPCTADHGKAGSLFARISLPASRSGGRYCTAIASTRGSQGALRFGDTYSSVGEVSSSDKIPFASIPGTTPDPAPANTAMPAISDEIRYLLLRRLAVDPDASQRQLAGEDDAYWGGKKRDGKRGRGATVKIPLVAAVSIGDKGHPLAIRFSQVSAFSKKAIKAWADKHLAPKRNVVIDGLECFTAFQECGHEHIAIITAGGPQSVEMPEFKWVNTIIGNVKTPCTVLFMRSAKSIFRATSLSFATDSTGGTTWSRW